MSFLTNQMSMLPMHEWKAVINKQQHKDNQLVVDELLERDVNKHSIPMRSK